MSNLLLPFSSFVHIPKCAGSLVQATLFHLHLPIHRYARPQNGHLFLHQMTKSKDSYNFCFVRHPYTWWPSFWQWSKKDRFSIMERECADFDTWLRDYGPFWMGHYSRLISRYVGEDPIYKSDVKMHFIGKSERVFDDLELALFNAGEKYNKEEFDYIKNNLNADANISKYKNEQNYNREISEESKEIIYNSEKYMFDRFNYKK